jgi:hypothetical protein
MVGSTYIHIKRNGRRTLLNVSQIASAYTSDIEIASRAGQIEYGKRYPLEQGTIYTIQMMLNTRREMEFIFARADERDEVFNQIAAALAPSVVIESFAPFVPEIKEEPEKPRKPSYPADLFDNQEDYALAMANAIDRIRQEKAQAAQQPSPTPPTPKPPRKPRK